MSRPRRLWLLPVSIIAALLLGLLPLPPVLQPLRPYWLALVVAFWVIEDPDRAGLGFAFAMGVIGDLAFGGILGEQALRLTVMAFILQRFRAQVRFFPMAQQALVIGGLLLNDRVVSAAVHLMLGEPQLPWSYWWAPLLGMALWAPLFVLLDALRLGRRKAYRAALMRQMRRRLKNHVRETAQFRARALLGFAIVVLALGGLAGWYFKLQVLDHADYAKRSEANRIKPRPVVPARGIIYDRKGRILADNVPAFRLDVVPEEAGDPKALVAGLSKIIALDAEDIARFERERKANRSFRAVTLKLRLSEDEVARFAVDQWRFPGVSVEPYLTRRYPYGALMAHIVGYVGRTDEKDIKEYGPGQALFTHTGRAGIERYYDEALRGKVGYEEVKTNVEGRALGRVGRIAATAGADLRLAVDVDLQRTMVQAFGDFDGSAVAVDPRTGEILAMVSLPSYDPNLFVNGISSVDYRALMDNPSRPLFNRNVLGGGPPGSTVKPFMALAGLESGLRRPADKVFTTGEFHIPGQ
jgi:rod shape-determining protein MreD